MFALFLIPLCIEIELLKNHEISTWSIPVFVFTLELIVKAITSFAVYWLNQNDADEGSFSFFFESVVTFSQIRFSGRKQLQKEWNCSAESSCL